MAEMIFKDLIYKNNKRYLFSCASRATSIEEIGNGIYPSALEKLQEKGIKCERHIARQLKKEDYNIYNYIIVMDDNNLKETLNIIGDDKENKIHLLTEYTNTFKDILDPWYTLDFETAYQDISKGCLSLYNYLLERAGIDEQ